MTSVIDDEKCFDLSLCVGLEPFFVTIYEGLKCIVFNILYSVYVSCIKAKMLKSSLDINFVLTDFWKVIKYDIVGSSLVKFGILGIAHYQGVLFHRGEVFLL